MDRFEAVYGMAAESFNADVYIAYAMESHLADLKEMTRATEAFDIKETAGKAGKAIAAFVSKAARRVIEIVNSIVTGLDNLVTRIGNMSHRKEIQVPKDMKASYDAVAKFIMDMEGDSKEVLNDLIIAANLQNLATNPDAMNDMRVAKAKLVDYTRDVAERLEKISNSMSNVDVSDDEWVKSKSNSATTSFNPSFAQSVLNKAHKHWKGVQATVKRSLGPMVNYSNTLSAATAFMKNDDPEADNLRKGVAALRSTIGGVYSAAMTLTSGMLKGVSMMSKLISAFIKLDKKFSGVKDVVEGKVVEKDKAPVSNPQKPDRLRTLTAGA